MLLRGFEVSSFEHFESHKNHPARSSSSGSGSGSSGEVAKNKEVN